MLYRLVWIGQIVSVNGISGFEGNLLIDLNLSIEVLKILFIQFEHRKLQTRVLAHNSESFETLDK